MPYIGYDRAAEIAHHAAETGSALRDAALELGYVDADDYDAWVDPTAMTRPVDQATERIRCAEYPLSAPLPLPRDVQSVVEPDGLEVFLTHIP